jgi:hypothetical protein
MTKKTEQVAKPEKSKSGFSFSISWKGIKASAEDPFSQLAMLTLGLMIFGVLITYISS